MKKQSGFTFIELMSSLALGVSISWVVLDISLNVMRSNQDIVANGDVVDKGVFLVDLLKREINHAGFYGRIKPTNVSIWPDSHQTDWCTITPTKRHLSTPVFGLNEPASLCDYPDLLDDSDVLMIRRASTFIPSTRRSAQHYIQSNFLTAKVATHAQGGFNLRDMNGVTTAPIREFYQSIYYVGTDNIFKRGRLLNGVIIHEPLMEGVDDFQVQYGIDTDGDNIADTFTTTPAYNDYYSWQNVKTVTVSLLISGERVSQPDGKTYNYADKTNISFSGSSASKKRRLFSFVVAVRNQN